MSATHDVGTKENLMMSSVNKFDVSDRIFDDTYYVYVPYVATVSERELLEYGVVGHHDKQQLESYLNDPILAGCNIALIAEINYNGNYVRFKNPKDIPVIYELVNQHLENWLYITKYHGARHCPPLKDIMALDYLAESLFPLLPDDYEEKLPDDFDALDKVLGSIVLSEDKQKIKTKQYVSLTNAFIDLNVTR